MNILFKKNIVRFLFFGLLLLGNVACTKYANPPAVFEDEEIEVDRTIQRKVLFISMDGAVGKEVQEIMPSTIKSLLPISKYTFQGLAESNTSDASTWMSMMSGISYEKHHIESDNFIPTPDPSHPHDDANEYPSVFYRLTEMNGKLRTYAITRNANVANRLLGAAYESQIASTDEQVKENTLETLEKEKVDFVVVQFEDVLRAGVQGGFSADNPTYKEAVVQVDGYIGEILEKLRSRENYEYEEWLIILTSNHGGKDQSYGGDSAEERNIFTMFANDKFKELELIPSYIESYRFYGYHGSNDPQSNAFRARNVTPSAGENIYDVATTEELTIDAKIKVNIGTDGNYSYATNFPFFGKNENRSGSTPGWAFFKIGTATSFYMADGTNKVEGNIGQVSASGQWTHISVVIGKENGVPTVKSYINGELTNTFNNAAVDMSKIVSTTGLTFGYFPTMFNGLAMDFNLSDIRIWNTRKSQSDIRSYAENVGLSEEQFNDESLIGYWPLNQIANNQFINKLSNKPNISVQGTSTLSITNNDLPSINVNSVLVKSTDIFTQAFYWMNMPTKENWDLDGKVFLDRFEIEFL